MSTIELCDNKALNTYCFGSIFRQTNIKVSLILPRSTNDLTSMHCLHGHNSQCCILHLQSAEEGMSARPLYDGIMAGGASQAVEEPFLLPDRYCTRTPEPDTPSSSNTLSCSNKHQTNIFWGALFVHSKTNWQQQLTTIDYTSSIRSTFSTTMFHANCLITAIDQPSCLFNNVQSSCIIFNHWSAKQLLIFILHWHVQFSWKVCRLLTFSHWML